MYYNFGHLTNLQPQAPQSTPEALPGPLEPPRGTSKPSRAPQRNSQPGGTTAEISEFWHPASGISYLPLLSHNNNTMLLRVFTRRHYNVLEAGGTIRGGWRVVGASPGYPPKKRVRIIRVLRINSVLHRMGRLRSPYDPSLIIMC